MNADIPDVPRAPRSTYRLQLGPDLGFADAARLVDYLADLGVTHVYCSPVLQARAGSAHGYDVVDPTKLSADLGGRDGFRALTEAARSRGLGVLVDLVPNHMGVGEDNPFWESLLREGPAGEGAGFFDVDWTPSLPGAANKVLLPILGDRYGEVLVRGELQIVDESGELRLRYHDHSLPLAIEPDAFVPEPEAFAGTPGHAETWHRLHALLEAQYYRIVHWRVGDALVNYRRFFAINDLAAVRIEEPLVFERMHRTLLDLLADGDIHGLRIDHIDGLSEPTGYLERLREAAGPNAWIVVEKILAHDEELPGWPVAGTTGYDFLADVVGLFVDPDAEEALTDIAGAFDAWAPPRGEREEAPSDLAAWTARAKEEVCEQDLSSDLERLVDRCWALTQEHVDVRDVTRRTLRQALLATVVTFDVYRAYTRAGEEPRAEDLTRIRGATARARRRSPDVPEFVWSFLEAVLSGQAGESALHVEVVRRFHQLASAAMAKGVEDTLLYRQHRLAALNDVGVEPELFGSDVEAFHGRNARRAAALPEGMLTTSTHDTKRGEDVRLRIAALSECSGLWRDTVRGWLDTHRTRVTETPRGPAPDPPTEYLCYQTLVGVWPPGTPDLDDLRERVDAYLIKAAREDGRRTSWTVPDSAFEDGVSAFVAGLLDEGKSAAFLRELEAVAHRAGEIAMTSSLSQVLLRTTSPGSPDTYQGLELWGDNLVDPDNRRPVDFDARRRLLRALDGDEPDPATLLAHRHDGRIKLWVLSRGLRARQSHPSCFGAAGGYVPLVTEGACADRVVAFARTGDDEVAVTVAPRLVGPLIGDPPGPPVGEVWQDTIVRLPDGLAGRRWQDALGGPGTDSAGIIRISDVLSTLPVALLTS